MQLRTFRPEDMSDVYSIVERVFREWYNPGTIVDLHFTWPEGFIVAEDRGRVIGFVTGMRVNDREARVMLFGVSRWHRGRGIGSALMDAFERRCMVEGIMRVNLEVRMTNSRALRFYWNRGFQIVDSIRDYYQNGDPAYVMTKPLQWNI